MFWKKVRSTPVSAVSPGLEGPETGPRSSEEGAAGHDRGEDKGKDGHGLGEHRGAAEGERQTHDAENQGGEEGAGEEGGKATEEVQLQSQQEVKATLGFKLFLHRRPFIPAPIRGEERSRSLHRLFRHERTDEDAGHADSSSLSPDPDSVE